MECPASCSLSLSRVLAPVMKIQEGQGGLQAEGAEGNPSIAGGRQAAMLGEDSPREGEVCPAPSRDPAPSCDPTPVGLLVWQLLEEDSHPMLSPRLYTLQLCQRSDDDTEVAPSPPNMHPFMSRQRSLSLGCSTEDKPGLTTAQLTKKIHALRRKIHKYEEKFEDEHKYRPSYSDKARNRDVLRWMNELSKLQKDLREEQRSLLEEDEAPYIRLRSNTLPRSFGSQLEREPLAEKLQELTEKAVAIMLSELRKWREDAGLPEDIQDMTGEQAELEKAELQRMLLYYERVHGRPVTEREQELLRPLLLRYQLLKQRLNRSSSIPVIEEEDDVPEDDGDTQADFAVKVKPKINMLNLLGHFNSETGGIIWAVDELYCSEDIRDGQLPSVNCTTMPELVEQLQEARDEKRRVRQKLREFEEAFFRLNGRNVQKEERSLLAKEYTKYKHIKAKLKLLEVLISKKDSSVFL
ncbi:protein FAM13A-like [Brienomyrus brachyistius]|uniref:protein FAM13A-like n=1 Tax=Brienomyrus brachyistius TaxID=42636 RepID=UPI0020B28485|nr:protein FAM13A-like [Brienomyrus brachyistius]